MTISLFKRHSKEEHANSVAAYLPNDDLWAAKGIDGTNLRKLLLGLALSLARSEDRLETVWEELDPSTTTDFIEQWESAVGIPDDCFSTQGTIEERRRNVVIKLNAAIQTKEDFEALAALLGLTVIVTSGIDFASFPLIFPVLFIGSLQEARFTMVVDFETPTDLVFPFTFPIIFPQDKVAIVKCLFRKLAPANVNIIFREV